MAGETFIQRDGEVEQGRPTSLGRKGKWKWVFEL